MEMTTRVQLSVMMFLQFFIWGAWVVTAATYLFAIGFTGEQVGWAYSTTAWAAIVSPFFIGMVADRFFPAQIVMGVLHLLGAVLMFAASMVVEPALFIPILLAYALCYMPTLALVNAVSFNQMTDVGTQFPAIRVFGTLGWITAGLGMGALGLLLGRATEEAFVIDATAIPLRIAAGASLLMGLYSFTLPHTPPKGRHEKVTVRDILGLDALSLMKSRSFAVFVIASLLLCIPLASYYAGANAFLNEIGMTNVVAKMTMGQMSEVVFMLVIPLLLPILGFKRMLMIGMAAWVLRYILFAYGDVGSPLVIMLYTGILLHGVCFDFFFVTGQIYVDKKAPEAIRASAQGFIALVTYGAGMAIGSVFFGRVADMYAITEVVDGVEEVVGHDWTTIWLIPAGMALIILVLFTLLFNDTSDDPEPAVDPAELEAEREDAPTGA